MKYVLLLAGTAVLWAVLSLINGATLWLAWRWSLTPLFGIRPATLLECYSLCFGLLALRSKLFRVKLDFK